MDYEYVREHYRVPACYGRRVTANGRAGVIARDEGHYIGVSFDDDKPGIISPCHPTWKVTYGDMGPVRRMSGSQERYQRFIEYGDGFDSFIDFCRWDAEQKGGAFEFPLFGEEE